MDEQYTYQEFAECCEELRSLYAHELNLVSERCTDFLHKHSFSQQQYNRDIKTMFEKAGLDRIVTVINPKTREEEKKRLCDIASSHLARRTFIGNLHKETPDPNIIGKLSGHKEGSRAFARYRDIDDDMLTDLVSKLN